MNGNQTDPQWVPYDGSGYATNILDGFLQITGSAGSTKGVIVFTNLDNGAIIGAFTMSALVRIGGGTSPPADGFSINYARASDPVVLDPNNGAFATGPNDEANLPEEGTQTGLGVEFDAWDSGTGSGGHDIVGVGVRLDNDLLLQVPMPDTNGSCDDTNSLQTGPVNPNADPNNPATSYADLCWQPMSVSLDTNGILNVTYKTRTILTNYQTAFKPSPGRIILAGRTGGSWENHDVDNLRLVTVAAPPTLSPSGIVGNACGFRADLLDSGPITVDTNSITVKLNGSSITPTSLIYDTNGVTHVAYLDTSSCQPAGTTNSVDLTFKDSDGKTIAVSSTYVVPAYSTVPGEFALTSGVDTNSPGFNVTTVQGDSNPTLPNTVARAEAQLAGTLVDPITGDLVTNVALPGPNADGSYDETGVINYNYNGINEGGTADIGDFQSPDYPDAQFPGIDPLRTDMTNSPTDSFAVRVKTFLKLQKGQYRMIVNSDDGFAVFTGPNQMDSLQPLGEANYGKGSSDVGFDFLITKDGYYPFRLDYFQGGGGANLEWMVVNQSTGEKILINDSSNPDSVPAYLSGPTSTPPYITGSEVSPMAITLKIKDDGTQVDQSSVKLRVNGADVNANVTKTNDVTTVAYQPPAQFPSGSTNAYEIIYSDNGSPVFTRDQVVAFTTITYTPLSPDWAMPLSSIDTTKKGFMLLPWQVDQGSANTVQWTEDMVAGLHGPNGAATNTTDEGFWPVTNVINYVLTGTGGGTGNFGNDVNPPGFPGIYGNGTDNTAMEILTYLDFPAPGTYTMGVNSDDGFKVSAGPNPRDAFAPTLGDYNAGRGAADTIFNFTVTKAGVYPFRLLWENGGGGAACEWFTVRPDGQKILVNDLSDPNAIKAYQAGPAALPYIAAATPGVYPPQNATGVGQDAGVQVIVNNTSGAQLDTNSVKVMVNGTDVSSSVNLVPDGNRIYVQYAPSSNWTTNSTNEVTLSYGDSLTPPDMVTDTWKFVVGTNAVLTPVTLSDSMATGVGSGDETAPGFTMKFYQTALPNYGNGIQQAEALLDGRVGDDTSIAGPDGGAYDITNMMNFNITPLSSGNGADIGDFQAAAYPDQLFPGVGTASSGSDVSFADETFTYVEFPKAGTYTMGVNSDDDFAVEETDTRPTEMVQITAPSDIVTNFAGQEATFSPALPALSDVGPISGKVVYANPNDGCTNDLTNASALQGNIALIDRGACNFDAKVQAAQNAGAIAVIIVDTNSAANSLVTMGGGIAGLSIPALDIATSDGDIIKSKLPGDVEVTLSYPNALLLGQFTATGGRGSSDTLFALNVPSAGVYPLRLVHEQGGGGANLEWFMRDQFNNKVLLNDRSNPLGIGLKAYRTRSGVPTPHPTITFSVANGQLSLNWTASGFKLQSSPSLSSPTWTDVPNGATPPVSVPIGSTGQYYRLSQ